MTAEELKDKINRTKNTNLSEISLDDVDDISDIRIDRRKSSEERILDFLNKVKNPYVFKHKGKLVRVMFSENGKTADDCLTNVLKNLYR